MVIYPDIYTDPMGKINREYSERMKPWDSTEVQLLMECLQKAWLEMMTAKASHRSNIQLDATTDREQTVDFCS